MTTPPPTQVDHPMYTFLLNAAGQDESDRAIVQCAFLHRPVLDDMEIWTCLRCAWCQTPTGAPRSPDGLMVAHAPVSCYAPCEELRLLAWPYRKRHGYNATWMPQEVIPSNPPTVFTAPPF